MIIVRLIRTEGSSAVIVHGNEAYIIDAAQLSHQRAGNSVEVEAKALDKATPFGIDWEVVYPDGLCINVRRLQEILYAQGVISIDDLKRNPNCLISAINQLLKITASSVYKTAKEVLEDV